MTMTMATIRTKPIYAKDRQLGITHSPKPPIVRSPKADPATGRPEAVVSGVPLAVGERTYRSWSVAGPVGGRVMA